MSPSVVTVGGKGSSLSPSSLYSISHLTSTVNIDSSALEKLSQSKKHSLVSPQNPSSNPKPLTLEESRAALAVLLNKLLLSDPAPRPALPILIQETLNLPCWNETLDFASPFALLHSICRLNSKSLEEIGVTGDEIAAIESSAAASIGICAILDCCASALVKLADAVAALSCEAARAVAAGFDLPVSGDGFSIKDETDVAGDVKVLLFGSKLVGKADAGSFADVAVVHGSFRGAVRVLHSKARVELNSAVKGKKTIGIRSEGKEKAFVAPAVFLARAIRSMSESSLGRARMAAASIEDQELQAKLVETLEKGCPQLIELREKYYLITEKDLSGSDYVEVLHCVYDLLVMFRKILSWEAAVALFALDMDDSIERPQLGTLVGVKENGENVKGDRKGEKKKKKSLGKGTSIIRQLFKDRFVGKNEATVGVLVEWAQELSLYFDPKESGLDSLLSKLKEIVESNEVRRLPKIPKVSNSIIRVVDSASYFR